MDAFSLSSNCWVLFQVANIPNFSKHILTQRISFSTFFNHIRRSVWNMNSVPNSADSKSSEPSGNGNKLQIYCIVRTVNNFIPLNFENFQIVKSPVPLYQPCHHYHHQRQEQQQQHHHHLKMLFLCSYLPVFNKGNPISLLFTPIWVISSKTNPTHKVKHIKRLKTFDYSTKTFFKKTITRLFFLIFVHFNLLTLYALIIHIHKISGNIQQKHPSLLPNSNSKLLQSIWYDWSLWNGHSIRKNFICLFPRHKI